MQRVRLSELLQGKEALITDLDGTLADLGIDWDALREKVRREMNWNHPLKPLGRSIPKAARNEDEMRRAFQIVEEAELEAAERACPKPAIRKILLRVKERGLKIGLVTLQAKRPAERVLEKLGIIDLFDVIVTREYSLDRKEQLLLALRKLGVEPERCVFFGDMPWDIEAGKELGCLTVCVRTDVEGADFYIKNMEGLAID